jgi:integrase
MAKALTVRAIGSLKPKPVRQEIPDGLLTGLYLVVQPSGAKTWAVRYRAGRRPRKLTLGTYPGIDLSNARELARRALVAVAEGRDPAFEKKKARRDAAGHERDLFENVAAQFIERYAKANTRESTWRETERLLNRDVLPKWKGRAVREISKRDVIELLDSKVDDGSPIMANRVLATVRRLFGWCVERGILEISPCIGVKSPAPERSRDRVLVDGELRLVWKACDDIGWPFGPLTKLLILTAQRRDEVSEMNWSELDLDAKLWTIPRERTKNDVAHQVPLSDASVEILCSMPKVVGRARYVFTTNGMTPVGGFSRAKDRIDTAISKMRGSAEPLAHWTFHDLRRTAASGMARLGIDLPVIEKVLNHTSGSFAGIVGVYQRHSFADEKRSALDAWARSVLSLERPSDSVVPMRVLQP